MPPPEAPPPLDVVAWCGERRSELLQRMRAGLLKLKTEMADAREMDDPSLLPTVLNKLMKSTGETADPGQAMVEAPSSGNVDEDRVAMKRRRDDDEELEEAVEAPGSGNVDEDKVAKKMPFLKTVMRLRRKKRFRNEAEELEEAMRVSKRHWQPQQEAVATGSAGASSSKDNEVAL